VSALDLILPVGDFFVTVEFCRRPSTAIEAARSPMESAPVFGVEAGPDELIN
jgi:hypothetical protein